MSTTKEQEITSLQAELELCRTWLAKAAPICERAARGDLEGRILGCNAGGDLGRMMHSINHLLDLTDAFVREAGASLEYASRGKFFRRVLLRGMLGSFRHASQLINHATEEMARQSAALKQSESRRLELADELERTIKGVVATVASSATEMRATAEALAMTAKNTMREAAAVTDASRQTASGVARYRASPKGSPRRSAKWSGRPASRRPSPGPRPARPSRPTR
jgi:hypothetical protein